MGNNCFVVTNVDGYNREEVPPAKMIPSVRVILLCPLGTLYQLCNNSIHRKVLEGIVNCLTYIVLLAQYNELLKPLNLIIDSKEKSRQ